MGEGRGRKERLVTVVVRMFLLLNPVASLREGVRENMYRKSAHTLKPKISYQSIAVTP